MRSLHKVHEMNTRGGCVCPYVLLRLIGRGEASMVAVLARLTLIKTKNKKSSVLLSWFSGTPYTGTQQNRSDKMHRQPAAASQAMFVSQIVEVYARGERSAVFQCMGYH
jgi:hypothetical protein